MFFLLNRITNDETRFAITRRSNNILSLVLIYNEEQQEQISLHGCAIIN